MKNQNANQCENYIKSLSDNRNEYQNQNENQNGN